MTSKDILIALAAILPSAAIAAPAVSTWRVESEADKFTDKSVTTATVDGKSKVLTLVLQCDKDGDLGFVIASKQGSLKAQRYFGSAGAKSVAVEMRVDTAPPFSFETYAVGALALVSREGTVLDPSAFSQMHKGVRGANSRILVKMVSIRNAVLVDEFPAKGAASAVDRVTSAYQR